MKTVRVVEFLCNPTLEQPIGWVIGTSKHPAMRGAKFYVGIGELVGLNDAMDVAIKLTIANDEDIERAEAFLDSLDKKDLVKLCKALLKFALRCL